MKSCFKCGVLLIENEKSCPSCGSIYKQEKEPEKEVAATEAVPIKQAVIEEPVANIIPSSKRVIIAPDPFTDNGSRSKHMLLIIISLIPVLNLVLIPVYMLNKNLSYDMKKRAKIVYAIVFIATLIIFFIVTKYNLKSILFNIKDFFRVIIKSFMGK